MPDQAPPARRVDLLGLGPVTTAYGERSAFTGLPHLGVDVGVPYGLPIPVPVSGTVTKITRDDVGGLQAEVTTPQGYRQVFAHLASVTASAGQFVRAGTELGRAGNSGRVTGPHLHYEVAPPGGGSVDPRAFLSEFGELVAPPLDDELRRRIRDKLHELAGKVQGSLGGFTEAAAAQELRRAFPDVPVEALRDVAYSAEPGIPDASSVPVLGGIGDAIADTVANVDRVGTFLERLGAGALWWRVLFTAAGTGLIVIGVGLYARKMSAVELREAMGGA